MNERIREIAKEHGFVHDFMTVGEYNDALQKFEKIAELIVRECCQLIDDSIPVYSPENLQEDYCKGKLDGYHAALLEIKGHFGVEE